MCQSQGCFAKDDYNLYPNNNSLRERMTSQSLPFRSRPTVDPPKQQDAMAIGNMSDGDDATGGS